MTTYNEIIERLYELKDAEKIIFKKKKFGIISNNSLGIYHNDLKIIAQEVGKNNDLAKQLFDSGIYEARILCSKMFNPKDVTEPLMEKWVKTFENWEICDSFCMGLFSKNKLALPKILEWTKRKSEYEKRAGFTIMASFCRADKTSKNEIFEQFFHIIKREANDERLYVKKAVNWALRNIGKRNIDLNSRAIEVAHELLKFETNSATWIAKNALTELQSENKKMADYPRTKYRNPIANNSMITGNRGEWSEIYTLFKILGDKELFLGNKDIEKLEGLVYPIIKVLRSEGNGDFEYSIRDELILISGNEEVLKIPISVFKNKALFLLNAIKENRERIFSIPEIEAFMQSINCISLKAGSSAKTDITIVVHDQKTNQEPTLGFSIKSQLGSPSTLLNAGQTTNFIYKLTNINLDTKEIEQINSISTSSKIIDRIG